MVKLLHLDWNYGNLWGNFVVACVCNFDKDIICKKICD